MKITSITYRKFESIGSEDYIGTAILTKDVSMSTGYRGRGIPSICKTFPSGTSVQFKLWSNGNNTQSWFKIGVSEGDCTFTANYDMNLPLEQAYKKLNVSSDIPDYSEFARNHKLAWVHL